MSNSLFTVNLSAFSYVQCTWRFCCFNSTTCIWLWYWVKIECEIIQLRINLNHSIYKHKPELNNFIFSPHLYRQELGDTCLRLAQLSRKNSSFYPGSLFRQDANTQLSSLLLITRVHLKQWEHKQGQRHTKEPKKYTGLT